VKSVSNPKQRDGACLVLADNACEGDNGLKNANDHRQRAQEFVMGGGCRIEECIIFDSYSFIKNIQSWRELGLPAFNIKFIDNLFCR
jgi:hypothetical protein